MQRWFCEVSHCSQSTQEISVARRTDENAITEIGVYELNGADGNQMDKGKYISIFKRIDGKLVPVRDIWNSDLPVMPLAK